MKVLKGNTALGDRTREFEGKIAKMFGKKYGIMVNSGSSANLLALAAACNFQRKLHLKPGDEVLIPAVCWSTSLWPLIQFGLKPVFIDVDPKTLNASIPDLEKKIAILEGFSVTTIDRWHLLEGLH